MKNSPEHSPRQNPDHDPLYFAEWKHDYDDETLYYADDTSAEPQNVYEPIDLTTESDEVYTDELSVETDDEVVASTTHTKEALQCYLNRYPQAARLATMVRPQDALSMIINIYDRYHNVATADELHFIDNEVLATVHEISTISEKEDPDTSPDLTDPYKVINAIEILESTNAPVDAIRAAEEDLMKIIICTERHKGENFLRILKSAIDEHDDPENKLHLQELVNRFQRMDVSRRQYRIEAKAKKDPNIFKSLSGDDSNNADASRIVRDDKDIAA